MNMLRTFWLVAGTALAGAAAVAPGHSQAVAAAADAKTPSVVFLIRHAEKPTDDKDPNLAPRGVERAEALPELFVQMKGAPPPRLPRPDFLFASDASKHSNRPMETILPLSQVLHEKIDHDYVDLETGPVAKRILSGKYAGKVVLVSWHHGELKQLAEALGVTGVHKWSPDVFDKIWKITWVDGQAQLTELPEHLLPGDSEQ
jgi:hypothetical protein